MTLHLTATTTEEQVLKDYLEQTVSEVLADKINNGVPVEKDGQKLISKKTLTGFMKYATDEARKQAAKGATGACVHSDTVFGWAIHYFEEDSILGMLYNEDGTEYKAPKPTPKVTSKKTATATETTTVPAPNPKPKAGQMSMFELFDEPAAEAPESPVESTESEVEQVPDAVVKTLPRLSLEHIGGFDVDTETGEVIEPEPPEDPYADTKLMYRIFLLLDQSIETVK